MTVSRSGAMARFHTAVAIGFHRLKGGAARFEDKLGPVCLSNNTQILNTLIKPLIDMLVPLAAVSCSQCLMTALTIVDHFNELEYGHFRYLSGLEHLLI